MVEFAAKPDLPTDPTLWNAAATRLPIGPCRVHFSTSVPRSSGLAGSTALLASITACIQLLRGGTPRIDTEEGRSEFAELVRDIELNEAGVVCGFQDAYMAVHGGLQTLDFDGKHPVEGGPIGRLEPIESPLPFLLITTGVERLSGSVHGPMRARWLAGEEVVIKAMERITGLGKEGSDALRKQDWGALGEAMDENYRVISDLGGSGESIDRLIQLCKAHGALGAKLAGAGLGGTVIALTMNADELELRLRDEGYTRFIRPQIEPGLRFEQAIA